MLSQGSIDCLCVVIDNNYISCLKKDISTKNNKIINFLNDNDIEYENLNNEQIYNEILFFLKDDGEYANYEDNCLAVYKSNIATGIKADSYVNLEEIIYFPLVESGSMYKSDYRDAYDLKHHIELSIPYIPSNCDITNSVYYIYGVYGRKE